MSDDFWQGFIVGAVLATFIMGWRQWRMIDEIYDRFKERDKR